jgi:hypothetical protein
MNYEDQFQKRYQDTLAKLAEGTAAGQAPEEVFKMIQTASLDKGNPTFQEAQALGPMTAQGTGAISNVEIENVERFSPEARMEMDLGKPLSEITAAERKSWMAMDRENNMPITMEEIQSDAVGVGTGAIGELPSSVEGFLGNLRRKIGE